MKITDVLSTTDIHVDFENILGAVAIEYRLNVRDIQSNSRKGKRPLCRQICFWLAKRRYPGLSLAETGYLLRKNHATVIHSVKEINNRISLSKSFHAKILGIESSLPALPIQISNKHITAPLEGSTEVDTILTNLEKARLRKDVANELRSIIEDEYRAKLATERILMREEIMDEISCSSVRGKVPVERMIKDVSKELANEYLDLIKKLENAKNDLTLQSKLYKIKKKIRIEYLYAKIERYMKEIENLS